MRNKSIQQIPPLFNPSDRFLRKEPFLISVDRLSLTNQSGALDTLITLEPESKERHLADQKAARIQSVGGCRAI